MNNQNDRPLAFGVYETTPAFQAIQQHSCVCYADDLGLVAVTGPADDPESQRLAELLAASPQLRAELIKAESFIAGFEDDDSQEGIAELLSGIRAALAKTEKEGSHE